MFYIILTFFSEEVFNYGKTLNLEASKIYCVCAIVKSTTMVKI